MKDLAKALCVTRQTLYNRFKAKEAVLDRAVEGFVGDNREKASAELKDRDAPVDVCLLNAFARWIGDLVPLLRDSPHGSEIMDMGTDSLRRSDIDHHAAFEQDLVRFLVDRGVCETPGEAGEMTFLLLMSSKGLLLKSRTGEEFREGMARILKTAIAGYQ